MLYFVKTVVSLFLQAQPRKSSSSIVSIKKNVHKQKRFLLCNLHELYVLFKEQNPVLKIGFSKFCSLHPKWCVTVGSTDTQSICVYTIHQNAKLLVNATKTGHTYKQLMEMKNVWFTGAKNVLGQTLYGNTLRTLLDDGFDRLKMALHPIVVYHKESSKLAEKLFCCNAN